MLARRGFIKRGAAAALLSLASLPSLLGSSTNLLPSSSKNVLKISPVEGFSYPEGFLKFIDSARFQSTREAIMSVRNQHLPYEIEFVEEL